MTEFKAEAKALQPEVTYQLRNRRLKDADNQRLLLSELGWHHDRGRLLRFLSDPWSEPTNHRAEVRSVDQKPGLTLRGLILR